MRTIIGFILLTALSTVQAAGKLTALTITSTDAATRFEILKQAMTKNVLGGILQTCCTDPLTGFYRDGKCNTGPDDVGKHHVCVTVNEAFLRHQESIGNDLITPRPQWGFPGLKPGDSWCICVEMWKKSHEAGVRAHVRLEATHENALDDVTLEMLSQSARLN